MTITDFDQLFSQSEISPVRLAVAAAGEVETLSAVKDAVDAGGVTPVLFGDEGKIREYAEDIGLDVSGFTIENTETPVDAAAAAVACVKRGDADFLMKGLVDTSYFLKAVLNKENGLPISGLLSHVAIFDIPDYPRLLFTSDGGMVTYPDLEQKKQLIKNALTLTRALGYEETIVGCLAAKEKVNPKMPATVEADQLKQLGAEFYFGTDVFVEGPIAMDLVFSKEAAETKGFKSKAAGAVDVLVFPAIETGNAVGKTLMQIPGARMVGTIVGAPVPIVVTSRADSRVEKLNSIRMAGIVASRLQKQE